MTRQLHAARSRARVAAARFDARLFVSAIAVLAFAVLLGLPGVFHG